MTGAVAVVVGSRRIQPITVNANWGISAGASALTSNLGTLTVPSGNPGVITFNSVSTDGTFEYSKNGGAYAAVTEGLEVSVASTNTIRFKLTGSSGNGAGVTVKDKYRPDVTIGTWTGTIL